MRSSGGAYFAGLDHVRGLAAFLVIAWHFAHLTSGNPVPFNQAPWLGPIDEGHLGVAVFMTLSGYLFAKLIGQKSILFWPFLWNRAVRLLPLLVVVLLVVGIRSPDKIDHLKRVATGVLLPTLPNGGWSITVEAHFYLLLPMLLAFRRKPWMAFLLVALFVLFRVALVAAGHDIQTLGYLTIFGRFDQFALGMTAFYLRDRVTGIMAVAALLSLWAFYAYFDSGGGFYAFPGQSIWAVLSTVEGATVATMIAWYDRHPLEGRWTWILERAGQYSYSIYLLHFFFVGRATKFVDQNIMPIPTLPLALPWAVVFFGFMMLLGSISWKFIEQPALRFRRQYFAPPNAPPITPASPPSA